MPKTEQKNSDKKPIDFSENKVIDRELNLWNKPTLSDEESAQFMINLMNAAARAKQRRNRTLLVKTLPGQNAFDFLSRFTSRKNRVRILDQTRRDDCDDYQAAVIAGDIWAQRRFAATMQVRPFWVLFRDKIDRLLSWNKSAKRSASEKEDDHGDDDSMS
jgi:hypothetical protein